MSKKLVTVQHVWAVVRVDGSSIEPTSTADLANQFVVKEILKTEELAAAEVDRLNRLNRDKGAHYFYMVTRLRDVQDNLEVPEPDEGQEDRPSGT